MLKIKTIKNKILMTFLPLFIISIISVSYYYQTMTKNYLLNEHKLIQNQTEDEIVSSINIIDAAYRMFEEKLDEELNVNLKIFADEYEKSNKDINAIDLDRIKKNFNNKYDLYIINDQTKVVKTTDKNALNFIFKDFSVQLGNQIDSIRLGNKIFNERLRTNVTTGFLSTWAYIPTKNKKYIFEIGYSINSLNNIVTDLDPLNIVKKLKKINPAIEDIKIFDTYGYQFANGGKNYKPTKESKRIVSLAKKNKKYEEHTKFGKTKTYLFVDLTKKKKAISDHSKIVEIVYNQDLILSRIKSLKHFSMIIIAIIIIILTFFIIILSKQITNPISKLKEISKRISRGDYSTEINLKSFDEISDFALTFNNMSKKIKTNFMQIENQKEEIKIHNKTLEYKVKKRTLELEIEKGKAEEANKAKSQFLSNMSHELRTPLNAVIGFSELLSSMNASSQQKNYLDSIKIAGRSLLALINDILDLSKIESGSIKIKPTNIDIRNIVTEICQIFELKVKQKGIQFIIDIENDIPKALMLDDIRIRQMLLNLIGNANKFTHKGYIKVSIRNLSTNENNSKITLSLSVEDTGIGINKNSIDKVFESFKQQNGHDSKKYGGTGLGLAICKKLALAMNGDISVKSTVEKGSLFEIILKDVPIGIYENINKKSDKKSKLNTTEFEESTILVVDDTASNRLLLKEILTRLKIKFMSAENGQIALDLVAKKKPDLILMDIRMPVLDGMQTTSRLKSNWETKDIPIVALTASALPDDQENIMENGFDGYLNKPFRINDLISILAKFIHYSTNKTQNIDINFLMIDADFDKIQYPEELMHYLTNEALQTLYTLKNVMIIGNVDNFVKNLKLTAQIHKFESLSQFGENLIVDIENFDTVGIEIKINTLIDVINKLNIKWQKYNQ